MRRSPITFPSRPLRTESRGGWQVVLEYKDEGAGPYMVDLSHCPRWDLQRPLGGIEGGDPGPFERFTIPEEPGGSLFDGAVLVNRMNRTQASIWHLDRRPVEAPSSPSFTDTTDATAFFALFGEDVFAVTEQLTNLDFNRPGRTPPYLLQGPFSHVPCQVVVLGGGILVTCSRGYGKDMTRSVLHAGAYPAGEDAFRRWRLEPETRALPDC